MAFSRTMFRSSDYSCMMRGFRTSANVHDGRHMLVNLEAAHKLVQRPNVLSLMENLQASAGGISLPTSLGAALRGKIVVTSHDKPCYRIEEIDFDIKPTNTFDRNGVPSTCVEYYRAVYNMTISTLVPELCNVAGLTDPQKNENRLKMDLIRASQVASCDQVCHLSEILKTFHSNAEIKEQSNYRVYSYGKDPCMMKALSNNSNMSENIDSASNRLRASCQ